MKTPGKILCEIYETTIDELQLEVTLNPSIEYYISRAINQAQIEAIDETVKACAEAARMEWDPVHGSSIDKQSILSVADQLKAKL